MKIILSKIYKEKLYKNKINISILLIVNLWSFILSSLVMLRYAVTFWRCALCHGSPRGIRNCRRSYTRYRVNNNSRVFAYTNTNFPSLTTIKFDSAYSQQPAIVNSLRRWYSTAFYQLILSNFHPTKYQRFK